MTTGGAGDLAGIQKDDFLLTADGRSESLPETTALSVRRAPHTIKVIKIQHTHFFDTLRDKMMWGADQRK